MTKIGPIRRLSDPRLEQHLLETLDPEAVHGTNQYQSTSSIPNYSTNAPVPMTQTNSIDYNRNANPSMNPMSTTTTSMSQLSTTSNNNNANTAMNLNDAMPAMPSQAMTDDYSSIALQHDTWLRDVQSRHTTAFDGLLKSIDGLSSKVHDCESKNNDIVNEIKQLDDFIENERARWKRRLDSEKAAMQTRVQSLYTGGSTMSLEMKEQ